MGDVIIVTGEPLAWADVARAYWGPIAIRLSASAHRRMARSRATVLRHVHDTTPIYSINTGFGVFARQKIPEDHLLELQRNLVASHAAGVGIPLPDAIVRLMMLTKLQGLAIGYSGVRPELAEALAAWLTADCLPVIPSQGSVGASGDLAPLAHLALALTGVGAVRHHGRVLSASQAIKRLQLPRLRLQPKEGLGLLNGTQGMLALAIATLELAREILAHADIAGALTIEGLFGSIKPFAARLHALRPHPGAMATARIMRQLIAGSQIVASHRHCGRVQDPYALRCIPAVHGAVRDAVAQARRVALCEANSVTDNPIVFPEEDLILSGGNFHGAPIALQLDTVAIALTTCASISERRINQMVDPMAEVLPMQGLTPEPGLHSGFMVAHSTAASLVSENKTLAHPASVDTIPTWAGQEDHVSMGMWGGRKALQVAENSLQTVAIELLAACQAIDLHPNRRLRPGRGTAAAYRELRRHIKPLLKDRYLAPDLAQAAQLVRHGVIRRAVERVLGCVRGWES